MADKSAFLSVLDWLDEPWQVVGNTLRGNPGAAGRHALDFLADIPDALIPGDAFGKFARPEDTVRGSSLLGIDRSEHPVLSTVADMGVEGALNPLSYVSFGAGEGLKLAGQTAAFAGQTVDPLSVVAKYARAGIDALPELDPAIRKYAPVLQTDKGLGQSAMEMTNRTLQGTRDMLGWLSPDAGIADLRARGEARAGRIADAKTIALDSMFKGTDVEDRKRAFRLINNYERDGDGVATALGPDSGGKMGTWDEQLQFLQERVANAPWSSDQKARAMDLAMKALKHERSNYREAVQHFPGMTASLEDGQSIETHAPLDYSRREFSFDGPSPDGAVEGAGAATLASRSIRSTDDLLASLNDARNGGKMPLEEDLGIVTSNRAKQQAYMGKQAMVGQELIQRGMAGDFGEEVKGAVMNALSSKERVDKGITGFGTLSDSDSTQLVSDVIDELKRSSPDNARYMNASFNGLEKRGGLTGFMAWANRLFKPAAVYGVGYPGKVSSVTRNTINFPFQTLSEESLGLGPALDALKRTPANLAYAFGRATDHVFGTDLTRGFVSDNQDIIAKAMQQSGGLEQDALTSLRESGRDDLAAMLEHGVQGGGFVRSEDMMKSFRDQRMPTKAMNAMGVSPQNQDRFWRFMEGGGEAFEGAEDYGRSRAFYDARTRNLDAGLPEAEANAKAAASVRGAMYDYDTTNELQRGLSDFIPFAKYLSQSTRQQANFLSRTPAVGTLLAPLYGDDGDKPIYPYLQEQAHVGIGKGPNGNEQYLSGLGLPIESLNEVPNLTGTSSLRGFGREAERVIAGSSQPLAKTAYTYFAGHDPMFDTPAGSYDRLPGGIEAGQAGRVYNLLMGTGLLEPVDMVAKQVGKLADDRLSAGDKALDLLTGAHVVDVDPKRALKQQLTDSLQDNPDVRQTSDLYVPHGITPDDDTSAMLDLLRQLNRKGKKHGPSGQL